MQPELQIIFHQACYLMHFNRAHLMHFKILNCKRFCSRCANGFLWLMELHPRRHVKQESPKHADSKRIVSSILLYVEPIWPPFFYFILFFFATVKTIYFMVGCQFESQNPVQKKNNLMFVLTASSMEKRLWVPPCGCVVTFFQWHHLVSLWSPKLGKCTHSMSTQQMNDISLKSAFNESSVYSVCIPFEIMQRTCSLYVQSFIYVRLLLCWDLVVCWQQSRKGIPDIPIPGVSAGRSWGIPRLECIQSLQHVVGVLLGL